MKLSWSVGVIAFFYFFGTSHGMDWSEPVCITDTLSGEPPAIAVANDGIAWVVESSWQPQVFRFPDEQTGWQKVTECACTLGTYSFYVEACFDKNDHLWVMTDNTLNVLYNCYHEGNWSGVHTVPTYPSCNFASLITADSSSGVWVAWNTDWFGYFSVVYNHYEDGGWGEPTPLTDTQQNVDYGLCSITTDANGRVWVSWGGDTLLKAAYYDGESWSEELGITQAGWTLGPHLRPDRKGGMWAIWYRAKYHEYDSPLMLYASYWDGESWSEPDTIADAGSIVGGGRGGDLTVDEYGYVWVVWRQALVEADHYGDIYYSVNTGSGWSEPAPVNEHPAVDKYPDIAVDGEGRIWCVWSSNREGEDKWDYSIWASYTTGVGIKEEDFIQPPKSAIESIYPNPFQSSTTISYSVAGKLGANTSQFVELKVFDVNGREVKMLASGEKTPGHYEIVWNGTDAKGARCANGVYFIRMNAEGFNANGRLVLIR
jgi:hypothetical protein